MCRSPACPDHRYVRSRVRAAGSLAALRFTKRLHGVSKLQLKTLARLKPSQKLPADLRQLPTDEAFAEGLLAALGLPRAAYRLDGAFVTIASTLVPFLLAMEHTGHEADAEAAEAVHAALSAPTKDAASRRRQERANFTLTPYCCCEAY